MDLEGGTVRRNYEGYSVKNKKTGKIVGVDIGVIFGDVALVFRSKKVLKLYHELKPNEEIVPVRVIEERSFE